MSEADKVFAGSIPENYDRHMVPLIFESYARDISQRVAALAPKAVLETAAGSGVVTRALAPLLSPDASYVVTDLNQPMLDYAKPRQGADSRIRWQKADAQALPFEDAAFDRRLLPVRRHVLSRSPIRLPGGQAGAQTGRMFPVQRLGPHRGERVRRRCHERAGGILSERPAPLHGAHAARLSRHRADPQRSGEGRFRRRDDRDPGGAEPRPLCPLCRTGLLPGHPAAQRDRGAGEIWRRRPTMRRPSSRAGTAAARYPPRSRRMSSWPET